MDIVALLDMTPCSLVDEYHCFRQTCCLHDQSVESLKQFYAYTFHIHCADTVEENKDTLIRKFKKILSFR
jgi:hypothetical protein